MFAVIKFWLNLNKQTNTGSTEDLKRQYLQFTVYKGLASSCEASVGESVYSCSALYLSPQFLEVSLVSMC